MKTFTISTYWLTDWNNELIYMKLPLLVEANVLIDNVCIFLANDEERSKIYYPSLVYIIF